MEIGIQKLSVPKLVRPILEYVLIMFGKLGTGSKELVSAKSLVIKNGTN